MSVNKAILIGNLGKDPEVRYLQDNTAVASLSLATSETFKNKAGEKVTSTEWHKVILWRKLAEVAEKYLKKGMTVYIEGKIKTRKYEKEGKTYYTTEIFAESLQMLGGKEHDGQSQAEKNGADMAKASMQDTGLPPSDIGGPGYNPDDKDNDLPF